MPKHRYYLFAQWLCVWIGLLLSGTAALWAQTATLVPDTLPRSDKSTAKPRLGCWQIADQAHRGRIIGATATGVGGYGITLALLNQTWYSQYERVPFHFFDDNAGWLQIDKVGDAWTAIESYYTAELYRWWVCLIDRRSGSAQGGLFVSSRFRNIRRIFGRVRVLRWATWLPIPQGLCSWQGKWRLGTQRIWLKFSAKHQDYSQLPPEVQARAKNLYGSTLPERMLKDYNGQSYWLSVNPSAFMPSKTRFPKWLNIAVGYGRGMLGAERNRWELPDGTMYDYTQWQRYRQYYLSVDNRPDAPAHTVAILAHRLGYAQYHQNSRTRLRIQQQRRVETTRLVLVVVWFSKNTQSAAQYQL